MSMFLERIRHDYKQSLATQERLRKKIESKTYFGNKQKIISDLNKNLRECRSLDRQIEVLFVRKSPHLPAYAKAWWNMQKDFLKIKEIVKNKKVR